MLTDTDRLSFQDKFKRDFKLIAQQRTARLVKYTDNEPDAIDARYFWFNYIGKVDPRIKTTFAGATPQMSPQHTRNRGSVTPYEWGDAFDEAQLRALVSNPKDKHKLAAVAGFYRKMDVVIINAALGNRIAFAADGTTSEVALPAAQLVAHGSAGMNMAKVLSAKQKFDAAEVDEGVDNPMRVMVHSAKQLTDLLNEAKATSSDYIGDITALRDGEITHWLGFDWVRSEQLPVNGSSHRRCFAMATNGVGTYMEMDPRVNIGKDPSASFVERIMLDQNLGATRNEDVRVVEVPCAE